MNDIKKYGTKYIKRERNNASQNERNKEIKRRQQEEIPISNERETERM